MARSLLKDACPALIAGAFALALYLATLAPGLTWAHNGGDGGDLLAAALTQGIPHPPGYPTYQLLLRAALILLRSEPARIGNLFSALCAALAVALLADLARRTLRELPWRTKGIVALAAGLSWATTPSLWGQAVITEVYALHALSVIAVLWIAWRWWEAASAGRPDWSWLAAGGLVFGLGLGNHLTLLLILPGLAAWFWPRARSVNWQPALRGRWRARLLPLAALALGLSVYAYLPWAARQAPPINWGDPSTPGGFWWLVSAHIYRPMAFGVPLADLPQRLAAWGAEAGRQLGGPWGMLLALLGLWRLERTIHRWWWTTTLIALAYTIYGIAYNSVDSYVYLIPAWAMACLWLGQGIAWLAIQVTGMRGRRWGLVVAFLLAISLPGASAARWWADMDLSRDRAAEAFLADIRRTTAPGAIILVGGDQATFALWYSRYGLGQRPDLTPVNVHLYDFPWYQAALLRYHPALATLTHAGRLPSVEQFVVEAARRAPLYRADSLSGFETGLREEAADGLVRLRLP